ncbi:glycosyltransferase family 2 protein [Patescibacteria group bacterium]|nr:MAG: glycosyltransferase family 2 protein [Patescibacteria group bacterium]
MKKLIILIPALNEERTIVSVIQRIPKQIPPFETVEIIVVDDGSSDQTAILAREAGAKVIKHQRNKGVGAAFRTGTAAALELNADAMVNMDGDGQFDPLDIPKLLSPIIEKWTDFTTCSRFKDKTLTPKMPKAKLWGNALVANIISFIIGKRIYDASCGFRAYSREALLRLNLYGNFTYTHESLIDLAYKGIEVEEVPLIVRGEREFGQSRVANNLWKYGYRTLKIILKTLKDYKPFQFFGALGLAIFIFGIILEAALLIYWLQTGSFSPFKFLGFIGGYLNALGVLIIFFGLIGDTLLRIRLSQENILYYEKRKKHDHLV